MLASSKMSFPYFFFPVPGIDGSALAEASLTDSYFSTSFIGVNGFGSPAEAKYPMMQVMLPLYFATSLECIKTYFCSKLISFKYVSLVI